MKIYLAGGMKDVFREQLLAYFKGAHDTVIDPATHGLTDERDYTEWDTRGIDEADVVVAFMTADNPSGYGLNFEVGYARAKRKTIIFIDRMGDDPRRRYFGMARASSRVRHDIDGLEIELGLIQRGD